MYKSSETRQYGMEGEERVQVQKLSDFELSSILFSYFTFHFTCTQSACALLTLISWMKIASSSSSPTLTVDMYLAYLQFSLFTHSRLFIRADWLFSSSSLLSQSGYTASSKNVGKCDDNQRVNSNAEQNPKRVCSWPISMCNFWDARFFESLFNFCVEKKMGKKKRMIQFLSFAHIERTFHIFANDDLIRKSFKCPTNYTSYLSTHSFCCRRGCNESHYNVVSRSLNRFHSPFIIFFCRRYILKRVHCT